MGISLDCKHLLFNLHCEQDGFHFLRKSKPFVGICGISFSWLCPLSLSVLLLFRGFCQHVYGPLSLLFCVVSSLGFRIHSVTLSNVFAWFSLLIPLLSKSQVGEIFHLWISNIHLSNPWFVSYLGMEIISPSVIAVWGPVTSACIITCHNGAETFEWLYNRHTTKRSTWGTITNSANNLLTRKHNWQGYNKELKAINLPQAKLLLGIASHIEQLLHTALLISNTGVFSGCWTGLNSSSHCC